MERAGHKPVVPFNPYWDRRGRAFEDPDGYRVVLQCGSWSAAPAAAPDRGGM
jgi:prolyl oligopeptidase